MNTSDRIDATPYEWELMELIGEYESFGGNYGAFNRGGLNAGEIALGSGIDPNLTSMIIADIIYLQTSLEVPKPEWLHAVGKYQIIGSTMIGLMDGLYGDTGVTSDMPLSKKNQDKLFVALAQNRIVKGDVGATIEGLKQEWIGLNFVPDEVLQSAVLDFMESLPLLGDWLVGSDGEDVFYGTSGADVFEMSENGFDIVVEFSYNESDKINMSNFNDEILITEYFSEYGPYTVINAGNNTMQIEGVTGEIVYDSIMKQDNIQLIATNFESLSNQV